MTPMFVIDPIILAGAVHLADWPLSAVLLQNDRRYPWLLLVPRREGAVEFADLAQDDRATLMEEIVRAQTVIKSTTGCQKLNTAALGLAARQLHVNVIGRFSSDAAWPKPVWGVHPREPYETHDLGAIIARLRSALGEGAAS